MEKNNGNANNFLLYKKFICAPYLDEIIIMFFDRTEFINFMEIKYPELFHIFPPNHEVVGRYPHIN